MALGIYQLSGSISSNTDTAIYTPTADETVHVLWMTLSVSAAGTTSRLRVEDAVGGAVLARLNTSTADAILNINYATTKVAIPGRRLTKGNALNINTSGSAAATVNYDCLIEVKGK